MNGEPSLRSRLHDEVLQVSDPSGISDGLVRFSSARSSPNPRILTAFRWLFPGTFEHCPGRCRWKAAFPSSSEFAIQILTRYCQNGNMTKATRKRTQLNLLVPFEILPSSPGGFRRTLQILVSSASKVDLMASPRLQN